MRLQTQWYVGGMGSRTGLNYLVVFAMLDRLNLSESDRELMFSDIRILESAALKEMNKGSGDE